MVAGGYTKYFVTMIIAFVIVMCSSTMVHADGEINANESRVIDVARGTFEYNGENYVAGEAYIDILIAKFSQDDIDLTSEQADAAISQIYANIEKGVKEGYIVKVSGSGNEDTGNSGIDTEGNGKPDSGHDNNSKPTGEPAPIQQQQVIKKDNGTVDVYTDKGSKAASFEGVLKNTGYSLNRTIKVLGVLVMLFTIMVLRIIINSRKNKKTIAVSYADRP